MFKRPTNTASRSSQSRGARPGSRKDGLSEEYLVVGAVFSSCHLAGSVDSRGRVDAPLALISLQVAWTVGVSVPFWA